MFFHGNGLSVRIDWEAFRPEFNRIHEKDRESKAGAKPFDVVLMLKLLVLQQLRNLSDDKTVWLFREQLKDLSLVDDNLPSTLRST